MKLQIDTKSKTIKLESSEKLKTIVNTLKKLLPNGEWQDFTLETNTVINNWHSPIVIEKYVRPYVPYYPWYHTGDVLCGGSSSISSNVNYKVTAESRPQLMAGTYNVEVNK